MESVQDRHSSNNKSRGVSAGVSLGGGKVDSKGVVDVASSKGNVTGANGGLNAGSGRTYQTDTVLTSLTAGESATIKVDGHTQINGALIATVDEDNKDAGNLTLDTETLDFSDLKNTTYAQNSAMGISTGVGVGEQKGQDGKPIGNTEVDSTYNSSTLQYQNSSNYSVTKTLATVGQGNVTVGGDSNSGSLTALNRDVENTEKDLFSVARNEGNVDVTVDHRLLTEKGRQSIKNDFVDSYEFGEDIYSAAEKLNEDDRVGLLSFWSALHNNAVGTQLKNQLIRDPENAHILAGLTSGDGDSYAQAMQELGHLAQEKFGLALTDIGLYDASKTTSTSLADNASKDVHGATVIDANNSEYGDIFIDIEGAKTLHVNSLGQELMESKTLQEGGANDETQEALSQMFGGQLEKRVDQATDNQLASTSTAEFSNSLANSQSVFNGTQKANKIGDAKVEYYLSKDELTTATSKASACKDNSCIANIYKEFFVKSRENDAAAETACSSGSGCKQHNLALNSGSMGLSQADEDKIFDIIGDNEAAYDVYTQLKNLNNDSLPMMADATTQRAAKEWLMAVGLTEEDALVVATGTKILSSAVGIPGKNKKVDSDADYQQVGANAGTGVAKANGNTSLEGVDSVRSDGSAGDPVRGPPEERISESVRLETGNVDTYKNLKRTTGDGSIHRDHQPSKAALIRRAEELKGEPLTPSEIKRIEENALAVTVPADVHRAGPTYGVKNTRLLQELDSKDLQAAANRDANAMVDNAKELSPKDASNLQDACSKITCITNHEYDDFLRNILDE